MFLQNKYNRLYFAIIEKARCQPREKGPAVYFEEHHVIPKALKGTHDLSNRVLLTAREHFICHWLLTKFTTGRARRQMLSALGSMQENKTRRGLTSRQFEIARRAKHAAVVGVPLSAEHRKRVGDAQRGKPKNPDAARRSRLTQTGRPKSERHRALFRIAALTSENAKKAREVLHTDEAIRQKKSASMTAQAATPKGLEQRAALAELHRNRDYPKDHTCPHCQKITTKAMHIKWHGDRCKFAGQSSFAAMVRPPGLEEPRSELL